MFTKFGRGRLVTEINAVVYAGGHLEIFDIIARYIYLAAMTYEEKAMTHILGLRTGPQVKIFNF